MFGHREGWGPRREEEEGTRGEGKMFMSEQNTPPPFLNCSELLIETEDTKKEKQRKGSNFDNAERRKALKNC